MTPDSKLTPADIPTGEKHELFPTPVMTFHLAEEGLNSALADFFKKNPRFSRTDQAERSDLSNLMDLAGEEPALARLEALFLACLNSYCQSIGWRGEFDLAIQMFPNIAPKGHYVPSHNHVSHISAVYYIQTLDTDRPTLVTNETITNYWRPDEGALILHDPRFNASLYGGWHYHAKVYPTPGLMILFPSFLWHEVTPHQAAEPRLSIAANFSLTYRDIAPYERHQTFSV